MEDLERVKDLFADYNQIKRYLHSKYLSNLNEEVSCQLFKSLWRITFKTVDDRCDENREINHKALRILFESNRELFTEYLKNNSPYFSEISNEHPLRQAIYFLGDYPHLFELLTEATREVIKAKSQADIALLSVSYFLTRNIAEHISMLIVHINSDHEHSLTSSKIPEAHTMDLRKHAASAGIEEQVNKLLVTIYINSQNFDAADTFFAKHIRPFIGSFGEEDIRLLIEGIGKNSQTHWRGRANQDHSLVVERANAVVGGFDVSKFDFLPQPQ